MNDDDPIISRQLARFRDELFDRGLRLTRQREHIFRTVLQSDEHVSAEDLFRAVRASHRTIGFATVYRTLRLLVDVGLVEVRQFGDGVQRYERAHVDHHDHIVCTDCGDVFEFENEAIEALQEQVATAMGFQIVHHRLDLHVRCRRERCPRRSNSPSD